MFDPANEKKIPGFQLGRRKIVQTTNIVVFIVFRQCEYVDCLLYRQNEKKGRFQVPRLFEHISQLEGNMYKVFVNLSNFQDLFQLKENLFCALVNCQDHLIHILLPDTGAPFSFIADTTNKQFLIVTPYETLPKVTLLALEKLFHRIPLLSPTGMLLSGPNMFISPKHVFNHKSQLSFTVLSLIAEYSPFIETEPDQSYDDEDYEEEEESELEEVKFEPTRPASNSKGSGISKGVNQCLYKSSSSSSDNSHKLMKNYTQTFLGVPRIANLNLSTSSYENYSSSEIKSTVGEEEGDEQVSDEETSDSSSSALECSGEDFKVVYDDEYYEGVARLDSIVENAAYCDNAHVCEHNNAAENMVYDTVTKHIKFVKEISRGDFSRILLGYMLDDKKKRMLVIKNLDKMVYNKRHKVLMNEINILETLSELIDQNKEICSAKKYFNDHYKDHTDTNTFLGKVYNELHYKYIVYYHKTFISSNSGISLIFAYYSHGDLFDYMAKSKNDNQNTSVDNEYELQYLSEHTTALLSVQLFSAIKFLHYNRIIHRDIKPENILIKHPTKFYGAPLIKITDFGLALQISEEFEPYQFHSLNGICGTPFYIAPEMLLQIGYGFEIDIWSSGVMIYLILYGQPPFCVTPASSEEDEQNEDEEENEEDEENEDEQNEESNEKEDEEESDPNDNEEFKIFNKILHSELVFYPRDDDSEISEECKDFLLKLMVHDYNKRLRPDEIIKHPWIRKNI